MTFQTATSWPTCSEAGCIGIQIARGGKCLVHASARRRNAALNQLRETGELDARGVPITQALLQQILTAAPRDADNDPTFTSAWFDRAIFHGAAEFKGATFQDSAWFTETTFHSEANFYEATFQDTARFDGATFHGTAGFLRATFQGKAGFYETTFQRSARFFMATFQDDAMFNQATFHGDAEFHGATFQGAAYFGRVTFQDDGRFLGVTFQRTAGFVGATFERARRVGPLLAYRGLELDEAQFAQPVLIEVSTIGVCCRGARFAGGVQLWLRWARVLLDDADLAAPSIVLGIPRRTDDLLAEQEQRIVKAWQRLLGGTLSEQPRLLSMRGANVAGLGLASVDLADCRFTDAHNLDKLRLEADVSFTTAPTRLGWDWRGEVLAEERAWRAHRSGRWTNPLWPAWAGNEPAVLEPGQIAGLYRSLRKGREDVKDEPGAADFYYGEMEMRRHARRSHTNGTDDRPGGASRGLVQRGILTVYWLVSGYGLRAWRALAWLLATVIVAAVGLRAVGFTHHRHPWSSAFLYTAGAVTHLVNPPDGLLTEPGQAIRIAIGLLGPVLLGLALLALRGRVKR